jgi:hypothetical protein
MEESETKKRKKKTQIAVLMEHEESQTFFELVKALEELEKEQKFVDVQICARCKSPKVRRVGTMNGDLLSHMGILPPKFEFEECGWRARIVLKATNRPLSIKNIEIITEAKSIENSQK